jgi:1-acyl-sn-glycerol-3-phosphate acyltransferase
MWVNAIWLVGWLAVLKGTAHFICFVLPFVIFSRQSIEGEFPDGAPPAMVISSHPSV